MKEDNNTVNNMNNSTSLVSNCGSSPPTATGLMVLGVFYVIIMVVSFTGNILVICTVAINRRMHTVTNYLIINLAVADLLLTVFNMPATVPLMFEQSKKELTGDLGIALCKLQAFIQTLSIGSSILNMNAIAVDRFLGIVFPLQRYVTFSFAYVMMAVVWFAAIGISTPVLYAMNVIKYPDGTVSCVENWGLEDPYKIFAYGKNFTLVLFLFFYAVPLVIISCLYSAVIYKLWIRKVPGQRSEKNEQQADKTKKKVLRMLLVVVIVFAVCWLPVHVTQFKIYFSSDSCGLPLAFVYFGFFISHANSAINPCLYVVFNEHYRKGFRDLLTCSCRRRVTRTHNMNENGHELGVQGRTEDYAKDTSIETHGSTL